MSIYDRYVVLLLTISDKVGGHCLWSVDRYVWYLSFLWTISATSAWHNHASWSAFLITLLLNCCVFAFAAYGILWEDCFKWAMMGWRSEIADRVKIELILLNICVKKYWESLWLPLLTLWKPYLASSTSFGSSCLGPWTSHFWLPSFWAPLTANFVCGFVVHPEHRLVEVNVLEKPCSHIVWIYADQSTGLESLKWVLFGGIFRWCMLRIGLGRQQVRYLQYSA